MRCCNRALPRCSSPASAHGVSSETVRSAYRRRLYARLPAPRCFPLYPPDFRFFRYTGLFPGCSRLFPGFAGCTVRFPDGFRPRPAARPFIERFLIPVFRHVGRQMSLVCRCGHFPRYFAATGAAGCGMTSESSCVMRSPSFTSPFSSATMRSRTNSNVARFSFEIGSAGSWGIFSGLIGVPFSRCGSRGGGRSRRPSNRRSRSAAPAKRASPSRCPWHSRSGAGNPSSGCRHV